MAASGETDLDMDGIEGEVALSGPTEVDELMHD